MLTPPRDTFQAATKAVAGPGTVPLKAREKAPGAALLPRQGQALAAYCTPGTAVVAVLHRG